MIEQLVQDVRYALRTLCRAPGFAALAVLTVAVGVGANAAIFSVVDAVLLRPLPYPRADDLVLASRQNRQTKQSFGDATPADFLDWRARTHSFAGLAAFHQERLIITGGSEPDRIDGAMVNANFFDVLGAKPILGRTFRADDEGHGAARVAIIGEPLWRERFGGRADVLGSVLRVNDEPHVIVGVMPAAVNYPDESRIWIPPHWSVPDDPLAPTNDPAPDRGHGYFSVLGRIKPGIRLAAAQADMDTVAAALERDYPAVNQNVGVGLETLRDGLIVDVRPTVLLLFAAVGLLLLIATANVAGLLIARATSRHQEIAVRMALGASRARVLGQLLTESIVLAVAGGGCGILLASWVLDPLVALSPQSLTLGSGVRIDATVLLFGLTASTAAGILFGLAPARQLSRLDVHQDLKQSARGSATRGQKRTRAALVVAEIALSLVLLVASGLTIRSFIRLQHVSTGFDPDHVVTMTLSPPPARYPTPPQRADFYTRTLEALHTVAGVDVVGAVSRLPLRAGNSGRSLNIPGVPATAPTGADYRTATPDYFRAMGIDVLRGRAFEEADREGRPPVAVISASLAQRFWSGRDPIGAHFSITGPDITIVGVVADVHSASLAAPPQPTVYVPYRQDPFPFMTFVVKSAAPAGAIEASMRTAVWGVDKEQPVGDVKTMDEQMAGSLARRRFSVTLLTAFGGVAVLLAAVGLYGVLAYIVAQRTREIGVRMALGASARDVVVDVLGQGLRLAAAGVALGVALAFAATRLMTSLLFETSQTDAATFIAVALLLVLIAAASSVVPAVRASRVDPLVALRDD
jgi:putative ABC transport system permease protein